MQDSYIYIASYRYYVLYCYNNNYGFIQSEMGRAKRNWEETSFASQLLGVEARYSSIISL